MTLLYDGKSDINFGEFCRYFYKESDSLHINQMSQLDQCRLFKTIIQEYNGFINLNTI